MKALRSVIVYASIAACCGACSMNAAPIGPTAAPAFLLSDSYMQARGFRVLPADAYAPIERLYVIGAGKRVILLHELPGLRNADVQLAMDLGRHFEVYVPLLFGAAGQDDTAAGTRQACHGILFHCSVDAHQEHPILAPLRTLVKDACADQRCGIVGMCLTGTVPLGLLEASPSVGDLVLAQPTLPIAPFWSSALDMTDDGIDRALDRAASREASILLTRYYDDHYSRRRAFLRLKALIEAKAAATRAIHFSSLEIPGRGHSTLVRDDAHHAVDVERVFQQVVETLNGPRQPR